MADKNIRLGSNLTFDNEKEADIIKMIEYLNSKHKTGKFISSLIRLAVDCPEIIKKDTDGVLHMGSAMGDLDVSKLSEIRKNFMSDIIKQVSDIRDKVDKIYEQSLKTYTLAQLGKRISLEGKSENNLMAGFVLEKQLADLQRTLGVVFNDNAFLSNKVADTRKVAEDAVELAVESYSGILDELKSIGTNVAVVGNAVVETPAPVKIETPAPVKAVEPVPVKSVAPATPATPAPINSSSSVVVNSELVDFGTDPDDLDILANFFGD